jgi:hypothetical protein
MRHPSKIETNAVLLLEELERSIENLEEIPLAVVLQMVNLKNAIELENAELGKDLEALYKQTQNIKN